MMCPAKFIPMPKGRGFLSGLSLNSTDNEETINIPYTGREILFSGNSSFSRMKGKNVNVGEYFYYRIFD